MNATIDLLRRRPAFRALWAGETVSELGDWLSWVAVSLLALEHGGGEGALAVAGVLVAHSLPQVLMAPVAGDIADRWDRRLLLLGAPIVQGVLTLGLVAAALADMLWLVPLLIAVRTAVSTIAEPARAAALPRVVSADELLLANTLSATTWSMTFAGGMALGGLVASLGPEVALLADAATFGIAVLLLWPLPSLPPQPTERPSRGRLADVRAALAEDPALWPLVMAKAPLALAGGAALVLLQLGAAAVPFAGTAALTLGLLQAVKGVGTGIGPALAAARVSAGGSPIRALAAANVLALAAMAVFAASPSGAVALIAAGVWGVGTGANWVLSTAGLQQQADDAVLGRLAAVDGLLMTGSMSAGALWAGMVVDVTGWMALGAAPVVVAAVGAAALYVPLPQLRHRASRSST